MPVWRWAADIHYFTDGVKELPGIERVVAVNNAVEVVADSRWHTQQVLQALRVEREEAEAGNYDVNDDTIQAAL